MLNHSHSSPLPGVWTCLLNFHYTRTSVHDIWWVFVYLFWSIYLPHCCQPLLVPINNISQQNNTKQIKPLKPYLSLSFPFTFQVFVFKVPYTCLYASAFYLTKEVSELIWGALMGVLTDQVLTNRCLPIPAYFRNPQNHRQPGLFLDVRMYGSVKGSKLISHQTVNICLHL